MRNFTEDSLTDAVVDRLQSCADARTREVLVSAVRHLHAFVREVRPTQAEWSAAIEFLTATGQKCDSTRQEFILLSDTLGVSMLVDAINHPPREDATDSTVLGPFFVEEAPELPSGADISNGADGDTLLCEGQVLGPAGDPIADAVVDVWQSDAEGFYDVQKAGRGDYHLRGRFRTDAAGRFRFWSIVPSSYPIPTDGPVGKLLATAGRHPFRPAHVHFMIRAPRHAGLVTHLFIDGDPYLDSDVVFGVKDSLIKTLERRTPHQASGLGYTTTKDHLVLSHTFRLPQA
jgi:hydroxyquinol 1,2-dioxygenase